jgi:hypothetical protein
MLSIRRNETFGLEYLRSNTSSPRQSTARVVTFLEVICIFPDKFVLWAHYRNLLLVTHKQKILNEMEKLKVEFEQDKSRVNEELEKLRLMYKEVKETKKKKLRLAELEAERVLVECEVISY